MRNALRRIVVAVGGWLTRNRRRVAASYLTGHGIEIGALHVPAAVPPGVRVRYVDRMSVDELRRQYPELAAKKLTRVDIVDDGQTLATIADSSEDFVIANHMLEHAEDPISTIENAMRVLKPEGVFLLTVPDKRYTFDADRPVTSLQHLLDDRADGGVGSRASHFREWVEIVEKIDGAGVEARAGLLMGMDYSIHFHVWSYQEMLELLMRLRPGMGFEMELVARQADEVIFVLRKPGSTQGKTRR